MGLWSRSLMRWSHPHWGYCNVLYMGLLLKSIWKFQLMQNAAVWAVMWVFSRVHVILILYKVPWWSVYLWVQFKMLFLTFKALYHMGLLSEGLLFPCFMWQSHQMPKNGYVTSSVILGQWSPTIAGLRTGSGGEGKRGNAHMPAACINGTSHGHVFSCHLCSPVPMGRGCVLAVARGWEPLI